MLLGFTLTAKERILHDHAWLACSEKHNAHSENVLDRNPDSFQLSVHLALCALFPVGKS